MKIIRITILAITISFACPALYALNMNHSNGLYADNTSPYPSPLENSNEGWQTKSSESGVGTSFGSSNMKFAPPDTGDGEIVGGGTNPLGRDEPVGDSVLTLLLLSVAYAVFRKRKKGFSLFLLLILPVALQAQTTYIVTNNSDSGTGSLRQAILNNNATSGGNTIVFDNDYSIRIATSNTPMIISKPVTITGVGRNIIVDGQNISRIFNISAGISVTIRNVTLQNGNATKGQGNDTQGGAINIGSIAYLTLDSVYILNCSATYGGGIFNNGTLLVINASTITGNTATDSGGGISTAPTGGAQNAITIINSTFSRNRASGTKGSSGGGAIYSPTPGEIISITLSTFNGNTSDYSNGVNGNAFFFQGSGQNNILNGNIIYGNGSGIGGTEIYGAGSIVANYNIIRDVPLVGTGNMILTGGQGAKIFTDISSGDVANLSNNGGPTPTFNIVQDGLAHEFIPIDTVSKWGDIKTDQRSFVRPRGCKVDAGALELQVEDDFMSSRLKGATVCPGAAVNFDTLIIDRINIDSIQYFLDENYTIPVKMPINIKATTTVYLSVFSTSHCETRSALTVYTFPETSTWTGNGGDNDWNNPNNWDNGIPSPCTNVIIPAGTTTFPILQPASPGYAQATCDTIAFQFGGEVAKTNYLQYNFAKVDLTLNKDEWYTVAPALQQQYSGDYLEDGSQYRLNPAIYMMYYQTGNPQTGEAKVSAKFTGLFNNLDELLGTASGQAVWIDEGDRPEDQFTIHFPKDSSTYNYYGGEDNHITRQSKILARDKNGRFIYEGNMPDENGTFTQTIENSDVFPQVIIGNPYMSHFDVVEFQKQNSDYLSNSFRIWKGGTSYETYQINSDGTITGTDGNFQVSPMQSFIIDTNGAFTDPLTFTSAMSVTNPGVTLKSSSIQLASDVLRVEILRGGIRQSGMAIHYKQGASRSYDKNKDVWTIVPQNFGSYVLLYSLVDGGAASIYTLGDFSAPVELGIAVGNTIKQSITSGNIETYTMRLSGDETQLTGKDVYLYDAAENISHNLTQSAYSFQNTTGDISGRFQLSLSNKASNGIEDISTGDNIRIFYSNGQVKVTSTEANPIHEVNVFSVLGQQLYQALDLNTSGLTFSAPAGNQVLIVKVTTERNSKTEKMVIR